MDLFDEQRKGCLGHKSFVYRSLPTTDCGVKSQIENMYKGQLGLLYQHDATLLSQGHSSWRSNHPVAVAVAE
jgi:hypothetical protein